MMVRHRIVDLMMALSTLCFSCLVSVVADSPHGQVVVIPEGDYYLENDRLIGVNYQRTFLGYDRRREPARTTLMSVPHRNDDTYPMNFRVNHVPNSHGHEFTLQCIEPGPFQNHFVQFGDHHRFEFNPEEGTKFQAQARHGTNVWVDLKIISEDNPENQYAYLHTMPYNKRRCHVFITGLTPLTARWSFVPTSMERLSVITLGNQPGDARPSIEDQRHRFEMIMAVMNHYPHLKHLYLNQKVLDEVTPYIDMGTQYVHKSLKSRIQQGQLKTNLDPPPSRKSSFKPKPSNFNVPKHNPKTSFNARLAASFHPPTTSIRRPQNLLNQSQRTLPNQLTATKGLRGIAL